MKKNKEWKGGVICRLKDVKVMKLKKKKGQE